MIFFFNYGHGCPNVLEVVTPCKRVYEDADDLEVMGIEKAIIMKFKVSTDQPNGS